MSQTRFDQTQGITHRSAWSASRTNANNLRTNREISTDNRGTISILKSPAIQSQIVSHLIATINWSVNITLPLFTMDRKRLALFYRSSHE